MRGPLLMIALVGMLGVVPNVSALGLLPTVGAIADPSPYAPNAVQGRYTLSLRPDLTAFDVQVALNIHELELRGPQGMPAQSIRDGGQAVHDLFEEAVRAAILREIEKTFPDARPQLSHLAFHYGASNADADLYRPGIGVVATATLPLSGGALGVPGASGAAGADWAPAFFRSGGSARIERTLVIAPGFDASLRIEVPPTLNVGSPGKATAKAADFSKTNMMGQAPASLYARFEVALIAGEVPQAVLDGPLVRATFLADDVTPLWLQAIPFTNGRYAADLDMVIEIPSLPTDLFEQQLLPAHLRLEHISADLIRVAVRDGLVGSAELEGYFQALIQGSLREDFGPGVLVRMDAPLFRQSLDQPIGSEEPLPLMIRAQTRLPLKSDHMLSSSAIARSVGMVAGTTGDFDLENGGDWRLELTLLYPKGANIEAKDSLRRLQEIDVDGRQGFTLYLAQGESTNIDVWGRPGFDPAVFAIGILELTTLVIGGIYLTRWGRARLQARRFPWAARS